MTNRWVASVAMLCPLEHRMAAAQTAAAMSGNPNDADVRFFSRPIVEIGGTEITHYLAHSRLRESVLAQLDALRIIYPGAEYVITQHDDHPELDVNIDEWLATFNLEFKYKEEDL